jgi:hypothetical protein
MLRETLKPQTPPSVGKLRLLNGIANSAIQPASVRVVCTSQVVSQSVFSCPFANVSPSTSAPTGLVAK